MPPSVSFAIKLTRYSPSVSSYDATSPASASVAFSRVLPTRLLNSSSFLMQAWVTAIARPLAASGPAWARRLEGEWQRS